MLSPYCYNRFISWKIKNCLLRDFNKKIKIKNAIQFCCLTNTKTNVEGYRMKICPRFYARTKAPTKNPRLKVLGRRRCVRKTFSTLFAIPMTSVRWQTPLICSPSFLLSRVVSFSLSNYLAGFLVISLLPRRLLVMCKCVSEKPVCGTTCHEFFGQLVCILFYAV